MKRLVIFGVTALLLASCATSVDSTACIDTGESVGGFWWGIWNGMTIGFSLIGSLFDSDISIYDVNNKGGLYDLGYWLGAGGFGFLVRLLFGSKDD